MNTIVRRKPTCKNEALLQRARRGDREAIGEVFAPHIPRLYRTTLRMLKNREDAEDALQDGLLAALRNLSSFEGRSQFATWLTRVVVNAALMQMRRSRHRIAISIDQPDGQSLGNRLPDRLPNPEELYAERQRYESVTRRLQKLRVASRKAVWLRHIQGLKIREVAEVLGQSAGSVKSQLHRAKVRLREDFAEIRRCNRAS